MEVVVEKANIKLKGFPTSYDPYFGSPTFEEEFTAYELDKFIDRLKEASKQARKNQRVTSGGSKNP